MKVVSPDPGCIFQAVSHFIPGLHIPYATLSAEHMVSRMDSWLSLFMKIILINQLSISQSREIRYRLECRIIYNQMIG